MFVKPPAPSAGDLVFEEHRITETNSDGRRVQTGARRYGFMGVDRVFEVEKRVRRTPGL